MAEGWPAQLAAIEQRDRVGMILHIGAGQGAELASYLDTGASKVVLVEPNADLVRGLERQTGTDERIQLIPAAVSTATGRSPFHLFNAVSLSSLRAPAGLRELFPGLREVGQPIVQTMSVADLLKRVPLPEDRGNILVIDAPGEEREILDALVANKGLARFRYVTLRSSKVPLFDGSAAACELVPLLEAHGYRVDWQGSDDPDFPEFGFSLDPVSVENKRLRHELTRSQERVKSLESAVEAGKAEAAKQAERASAAAADTARVVELDKAKAQAEAAMATSRNELATARQDLAVALRLQAVAQSDLRELQERYRETLRTKERQEDLLHKLTPRLQEAAQYVQGLTAISNGACDAAPSPKKLRKKPVKSATKQHKN